MSMNPPHVTLARCVDVAYLSGSINNASVFLVLSMSR